MGSLFWFTSTAIYYRVNPPPSTPTKIKLAAAAAAAAAFNKTETPREDDPSFELVSML
jgi:hypothetical protein